MPHTAYQYFKVGLVGFAVEMEATLLEVDEGDIIIVTSSS